MAERKKVAIGGKPNREREAADAWVSQTARPNLDASHQNRAGRQAPAEAMKRFTIDVPASLHSRIKVQCAREGQKMSEVIRALLEERFPDIPER